MPQIYMLNDVSPEDYEMKGQYGWADRVQWLAGETYNVDQYIADMFINNDDAISLEEHRNNAEAFIAEGKRDSICGIMKAMKELIDRVDDPIMRAWNEATMRALEK